MHTHTRTRRLAGSRCRVKTARLSFDLNSDRVADAGARNALNHRVALITLSFEPGSLAS